MTRARIAIVGASGYTGAELLELLLRHPDAEVVALFGSERQDHEPDIASVHPRFRGRCALRVRPATPDAIAGSGAGVAFLATPHEAALDLAPALLERGLRVLDLSAAFRLPDASAYPSHYGFEHTHPAHLASAVYGLPEINRGRLHAARLVAVPGCYPTASILALRPMVDAGLLRPGSRPIIDATSGISGAGRAAKQANLFCEVSQRVYGVFSHRHQPEIDTHAGVSTIFTPHVGPYERGILATVHIDLPEGTTDHRVRAVFDAAYAREPFVKVLAPGSWPAVGDVARTNMAHLALAVDEARAHAIVCVAIDNLLKGASGQAVQCMNALLGLDETRGLLPA